MGLKYFFGCCSLSWGMDCKELQELAEELQSIWFQGLSSCTENNVSVQQQCKQRVLEEICCVYSSGAGWLLESCWVTAKASLIIVKLSLFTLFFAPILTIMHFGNSQWGKLTGNRIGVCAWWSVNPAHDTGFNKSLLIVNILVCSFCWEQKVELQLCQAGEKEGEAELQEMVSSCPNVDAVLCCELLYL